MKALRIVSVVSLLVGLVLALPVRPTGAADTDPRLYQSNELWNSREGPPLFRPREQNVLILHGWNGSPADPCMRELARCVGDLYHNVLLYQYPSAQSIGWNATWLHQYLSPLLADPATEFDIVAYSEGGLVARAAKEPGKYNGGAGFGARVRNLVTIATPHAGLDDWAKAGDPFNVGPGVIPPGLSDMLVPGSGFLKELNAAPVQASTRYSTIAGRAFPNPLKPRVWTDRVVSEPSAHAVGVLKTAARATFRLVHNGNPGEAGMPCHPLVSNQIKAWVLNGRPEKWLIAAGEWDGKEEGSVTCSAGGDRDTETFSGEASITIEQNGATLRWELPDVDAERRGVIQGNRLRVSGPATGTLDPDADDVVIKQSRYQAEGILDCGRIVLKGSLLVTGTLDGTPFTCRGTSTVVFVRSEPAD